jgi:hypothetical protein
MAHGSCISFVAAIVAASAAFSTPADAQQSKSSGQSSIGYPSVAAALDALRAKSNVRISVQGGWTIVDDREDHSIWSFTPSSHPAHPAAVKRTVVEKNGAIYIEMSALCQASKSECDKLIAEFKALNEQMRKSMRK